MFLLVGRSESGEENVTLDYSKGEFFGQTTAQAQA